MEIMRLKPKITTGAVLLSAIPVLASSLIIGSVAANKSREAIQEAARNRLVAVRELSKRRIEDYFATIKKQVLTLSKDRMVVDAMNAFKANFYQYRDDISDMDLSTKRSALESYYRGDFTREYAQRNQGEYSNTAQWLSQLDADSIALQHSFIKTSPYPLGEKHKLDNPGDGSRYAKNHALYHPVMRDYLEQFGYYDIFLVDPDNGDIVYSVFKELDFTTSLQDGPYAHTGIGEVFRKANQVGSPDFAVLSDFAPYAPSYQDPAAFIASPIYDGNKKSGVLIFQMPIERINAIMTQDRQWAQAGLGESGETYLVGADGRMRSMSRFLLEDKASYAQALKDAGVAEETVELIVAKATSIGLQPIDTVGSRAALSGKTGFDIFPDYRQVPVLSAYAPVDIEGVNWAILAEIDEQEAFRAADALVTPTKGLQAMQETITQIQQLAGEVERAAGTIQQLEQHTEEIGSVLDVIKGIAKQTNLLALNAAIEAARAGEQGRGFSVVAAEVRDLTSKTQASTAEINQMIKKLQGGSRQAVLAMDHSQEKARGATEQASKTGDALSSITEAIGQIDDMSTQIASAAEEQNVVADEINKNVAQINSMTEQTSAGAKQTSVASDDLTRLASGLQSMVVQFKVQ